MRPPPLRNGSTSTVQVVPQVGMNGASLMVVIIKELFHISKVNQVARIGGAKIRLSDEPWDEDKPEQSPIKLPSDLCIRKPSTDVVVVASAIAKGRQLSKSLDVTIRVGQIEKHLRVWGTRVWQKGIVGLSLSSPQPFESVPLRWDYAYGGFDASDPDRPPLEEPRNPVGRGLARKTETLLHQPGPQIEDPRHPISSPNSKVAPAGVGAIGRHWEPRRRYTGTMDKQWMTERMPLPPLDFDDRFNQAAAPELTAPTYLRGGELVEFYNVSRYGPMRFQLPKLRYFVGAMIDGQLKSQVPVLDTVLLEPTVERTVELTWRAALPMPKRMHLCEFIQVHEKAFV